MLTLGNTTRDAQRLLDTSRGAIDFVKVARVMMEAGARGRTIKEMADDPDLPARVQSILARPFSTKPISGPQHQRTTASTVSVSDFTDFTAISQSFLDSVGLYSAFQTIANAGGFTNVPLRTRIRVMASQPSAGPVGELQPIPVMHETADIKSVEPTRIVSMIGVDDELLKLGGTAVDGLIGNSLRRAVGEAVDVHFLAAISDGAVSNASTGLDPAHFLADLDVAVQAITSGNGSKWWCVVPSNVAKALSFMHDSDGLLAFPGFSPAGGVIGGVRLVASEATSTVAYVMDSAQILVSPGVLELAQSNEALLQLSDSPSADQSETYSLWQHGVTSIRASHYFSAVRGRNGCVAAITGLTTV